MIPKIIHFCWFGKNEHSPLVKMCIESWKRHLPDYKIMLWNEETFDVNSVLWTKEAYSKKKWAFVSDYVRLYALKKYGGVYLDTDVEVIKDFSCLLLNKSYVSSFVEKYLISAGFIACEEGHQFVKELLKYYENKHFIDENGKVNQTMNPLIFTKKAMKYFMINFGTTEFISNSVSIFSHDYFMPYKKNMFMEKTDHKSYHLTNNTFTIHHDMGSWAKKNLPRFKGIMRLVLPENVYLYLKKIRYSRAIKNECIITE